jgi:hypothetical protein
MRSRVLFCVRGVAGADRARGPQSQHLLTSVFGMLLKLAMRVRCTATGVRANVPGNTARIPRMVCGARRKGPASDERQRRRGCGWEGGGGGHDPQPDKQTELACPAQRPDAAAPETNVLVVVDRIHCPCPAHQHALISCYININNLWHEALPLVSRRHSCG